MSVSPFPEMEARGTSLPPDPLNNQLFFLDVPNDADPPRGWYQARVGFSGGTDWVRLPQSTGDQGDIVRPAVTITQPPLDETGL
jgi:hypothetical protein